MLSLNDEFYCFAYIELIFGKLFLCWIRSLRVFVLNYQWGPFIHLHTDTQLRIESLNIVFILTHLTRYSVAFTTTLYIAPPPTLPQHMAKGDWTGLLRQFRTFAKRADS